MESSELKKTPLNQMHRKLGAKMMDFAGWDMPVWYTSILEEHKAVRTHAGIFDVSDMGRVWVTGKGAGAFLDKMLTKPPQSLPIGGAQLCLLCFENGGILDDLWVYRVETDKYLIVWNAAKIESKRQWLDKWAGKNPDFRIDDVSAKTVMLAVQGPSVAKLECLKTIADLPRFGHKEAVIGGIKVYAARTGYTGEDGFEIIADIADTVRLWELFTKAGVKPCGLGCRDMLRLEAGMMLCGQDMDSNTNPFEASLGWLVNMEGSDFIGKKALIEIKQKGIKRKLIGFEIQGREIARNGYKIFKSGKEVGVVTSGGNSPMLNKNVGFGYVPVEMADINTSIDIMIRNKPVPAKIVNKKFYKRGG
ncbi:MAG TPA: glycine cleavage system aminomethyltransferase GcvT [Dehalococcoidia bacterium]|nr:glycine cleavage system aminomethyltransferase GcvT [Dehalococcoidia bacterium]